MKSIIKSLMVLSALLLLVAGCEYDGPTSQWKLVEPETDPPVITEVDPSVALAGMNYITIHGDNFTDNQENVSVYISGYQTEIVDFSNSLIKVRRPDRSGDSLSIRVDIFGDVNLGRWEPYTVASVYEPYGEFLSGNPLASLSIDEQENIYVAENTTAHDVYEISASGEKKVLGHGNSTMYGSAIQPNGKLLIFSNNEEIYSVEPDSLMLYATAVENVKIGVFDSQGILFASGNRADINIVLPDRTARTAGLYPRDEVLCLRVVDNMLFALISLRSPDASHPAMAIWRHQILDDQGNLGDPELVFDWASAGEAYAESEPATFTLDTEGGIYIGSDNAAPILYYDPSTGHMDDIYKGILPSAVTKLLWGSGDYMYMIYSGGATDYNLFRIDMGRPQDRDF